MHACIYPSLVHIIGVQGTWWHNGHNVGRLSASLHDSNGNCIALGQPRKKKTSTMQANSGKMGRYVLIYNLHKYICVVDCVLCCTMGALIFHKVNAIFLQLFSSAAYVYKLSVKLLSSYFSPFAGRKGRKAQKK